MPKAGTYSTGSGGYCRRPLLTQSIVIHCLGPIYGVDQPSDELLAACYRNALRLAEENNIQSIAFPAISTDIFGYPPEYAAYIAINAVLKHIYSSAGSLSVHVIRFVLFNSEDQQRYAKILGEIS